MSSTADAPAVPKDERREEILARIQSEFGDAVVDSQLKPNVDLWVRVTLPAWPRAHEFARDALQCQYFCFLSAIDWMPSPFGKGEDDPTEPARERDTSIRHGYAGGETRFQLFSRVYSPTEHHGLFFKVDVADEEPVAPTISSVYAGANWHERETWEMFGIRFAGHPQLTKLYLPGHFEGFPLRKDYPLLSRTVKPWPGIVDVEPMPGEAGEGDEQDG